uniref:Cystathionine beta-lyase n=1 Tax=Chromera velia CCMP2878 TaxID=1169474 RepID=A0A0G4GA06_9ALVE|eukprot:Cvel_20901.t1-p1 / transcript=Cvel_20901.t1 / gene=Cvel_20901 / organism=Chromera_velia_CCMP2878 / gene_product=Methionine gamma-lyase, putative / transcript_product=Methionine gamma-lyase, putative / location=Cvel_scaffold1917:16009-18728(+) / protein_length=453 / sequence_SO=supercontig / SO=protein_coding / is_pseudo=false
MTSKMEEKKKRGFATSSIHSKYQGKYEGAMVCPIFQSATYVQESFTDYASIKYLRLCNSPNHEILKEKLMSLEGAGEDGDAIVTASGMAAISSVMLGLLSAGDELLIQGQLYGATYAFVRDHLPRFGIRVSWFNPQELKSPEDLLALITPHTKMVYVEGSSNPLMRLTDLKLILDALACLPGGGEGKEEANGVNGTNGVGAHDGTAGLKRPLLVVDNTFLTPFCVRPLELGVDIVCHSATKYLGGHGDLCAGSTTFRSASVAKPVRNYILHVGCCLDPHSAFLLDRGLKTLSLRMERHVQNAGRVADALASHPAVARVHYAGLKSHRDFELSKRLLSGPADGKARPGAMVSFELNREVFSKGKGFEREEGEDSLDDDILAAMAFSKRLRVASFAPSLGGPDTLVTVAALSTHAGLSKEEREAVGIPNGLIRIAVGLEDADDLVADFLQALDRE